MITIEEIFNFTKSELKNKLLEYKDETHYSNNLERINAVIIHSFNNKLLNSEEMEIVESDNYDRVMNLNPKSYLEFLNLLNTKKKINININPELLKSWNTPKITTLEGHTHNVNSVVVSSDNKYIISGSFDRTIKIWNLSTFELVTTLEGHTDSVSSVVVSGNKFGNNIGKQYIISGSSDTTIKIWDLSTFELVTTLEGHTVSIYSVAVSGIINTTDKFGNNIGKQYIISGSYDRTIKIWDLSTFRLVATLEGHTASVNSVVVSGIINYPNNISKQYIISGSFDETIKIWDLSTFKLVKTLEGHTNFVMSVAVISSVENTTNLPDNIGKQYIISGSYDSTIKIWDFSTFELVKTLEGHTNSVNSVVISSDNKYIISGSYDHTIKIWDLSTFKLVTTLEKHTGSVNSVTVSSSVKNTDKFEKQYIISGSNDDTIKIWEQN